MRSCLIDIGNSHCPGLLMKPVEGRERETLDITGGGVWARRRRALLQLLPSVLEASEPGSAHPLVSGIPCIIFCEMGMVLFSLGGLVASEGQK